MSIKSPYTYTVQRWSNGQTRKRRADIPDVYIGPPLPNTLTLAEFVLLFFSSSLRFQTGFSLFFTFFFLSLLRPVLRLPANSIIYPAATQTLRSQHGTFSDLFHNGPLNDGGHPVDPDTIVAFFTRKSWADLIDGWSGAVQ